MTIGEAPGKIILFGEHAVVYGMPAIAIPVRTLRARALVETIEGNPGAVMVEVKELGLSFWLDEAEDFKPLVETIRILLNRLGLSTDQCLRISIHSTIPVASGLGSSAALSAALLRALADHNGNSLPLHEQSSLVYETEKIHHGTPSGIDNTVIIYDRPIYFQRNHEPEFIKPDKSLTFLVASSGQPSLTGEAVAGVRERWLDNRPQYDSYFEAIGSVVEEARSAFSAGDLKILGTMMNRNQELLEAIGVHTSALEKLIQAATKSGAAGAKLSGAGLGGNVIALVTPATLSEVRDCMLDAEATAVYTIEVDP